MHTNWENSFIGSKPVLNWFIVHSAQREWRLVVWSKPGMADLKLKKIFIRVPILIETAHPPSANLQTLTTNDN
jgi:hypothetical protein